MFVNENVLKRLIKAAWKGGGLHIEHTSEGWFAISGMYWSLEIDDQMLSNKVKAQIVELIGEIPEPGVACLYIKNTDPQYEVPGATYRNRMAEYDNLKEKSYQFSNVYLKAKNCNIVLLEGSGLRKVMIPEWAADLYDADAVEYDETKPEPGATDSRTAYVIWRNNVMSLMVLKREIRYQGEREFLDAVEEASLCWEFDEDEEF